MKKILATILAISLILGTLFTGMGAVVSAETAAATSLPVDQVGKINMVPYVETDYDAVSNFGTNVRISNLDDVSITKTGVNGSYGLEVKGTGALTTFVLKIDDGVSNLKADTVYTFEMKVKSVGAVGNLSLGLRGGHSGKWGGSWQINNGTAEITEWKTYKFEVDNACASGVSPTDDAWEGYMVQVKAPEGATVYIDDCKIYEKNDAAQTNVFEKGSFEKVTYSEGDKNAMVKYAEEDYNSVTNFGESARIINMDNISITKTGRDGSYGLEIRNDTEETKTYSFLLGFGGHTNFLKNGVTYSFECDTKSVGVIPNFRFGLRGGQKEDYGSWKRNNYTTEITDWTTYVQEINNTVESPASQTWEAIRMECKLVAGAVMYIDNIKVYDKGDATKTNIFEKDTFEISTQYASEPAGDEVSGKYTYEPRDLATYRQKGATASDGTVDWGDWDANCGIGDGDTVAITEGGYDGSYALKITGVDKAQKFALNNGINGFAADTTYVIRFKARLGSADDEVLHFSMGLMKRWSWQQNTAIAFEDYDNSVTEFTTSWTEYAATVTTASNYTGNYTYLWVGYDLLEDSVLYLDDIEVVKADTTEAVSDGKNYFAKGTFDVQSENFTATADADFKITPKYYTNWATSPSLQAGTPVEGFTAKAVVVDNAPDGNNVLMVGHDDAAYNGRIWYELAYVRPAKTYHVEFWVMPYGNLSSASIKISDNDPYNEATQTEHPPQETTIYSYTSSSLLPNVWTKVSVDYTDTTTATGVEYRWAGMNIGVSGAAGSGILVDNISIRETAVFGDEAPNLFSDASFETITAPEVEWNDCFFGSSATDYSFMNNIPKEISIFGGSLKYSADIFADINENNGDFSYNNTYVVDTANIDVARFEAKYAAAQGKSVWLSANSLASSNSALSANWQNNVTRMAAFIQNDIGDAFQGFYFDEPHLHFASNDEFITITKYMRETLKKRVFSMTKHDMFGETPSETCPVTVTAESHAYVTDIGYWNYQLAGMETRIAGFRTAASRLDGNVRKWICTLYGTKNDADTEEKTMQIFTSMLEGAKNLEGFGGIMLYSCGDTNGYNLHKPNENGVAQYENYRQLLLAVADEFKADFAAFDAENLNEDGVFVLDTFNFDSALYAGKITINGDIKTGATVTVEALTSTYTATYEIAVKNDVNGDGAVGILDLIRSKKLSAGAVEGTSAQYAAAGTTVAAGITATELSTLRTVLLG